MRLGTLAVSLGCSPLDDGFYHSPPDCHDYTLGIRSLIGFGTLVYALAHSVLYPLVLLHDAIPKYISERTSYHDV